MNTQSHAILSFFLIRRFIGKRAESITHLNHVLFAGALFPDIPIYIFFIWHTFINPSPQNVIWRELYFRPDWQLFFSPFHSFPIWLTALCLCLIIKKTRPALFCLSGFLAAAQDFFLHYDDGHPHLFPFSDYRFMSPVSYWDQAHYGDIASVIETVLVIAAGVWTFSRLKSRWGKVVLIIAVLSLLATNTMWRLLFTFS